MRITSWTDGDDAGVVVAFVADVAGVDAAGLRRDLRQRDHFLGLREAAGRVEQSARQAERARPPCRGATSASSSAARRGVGARFALPMTALPHGAVADEQRDVRADAAPFSSAARCAARSTGPPPSGIGDDGGDALREQRLPLAQRGVREPSPACECTSMKPGVDEAIARVDRRCARSRSGRRPTAAMRSPRMPMSARSQGLPVPSMTRPLRIRTSKPDG